VTLSILERLAKIVESNPDQLVFASLNQDYTYQTLWQAANSFANMISQKNLAKGPVIVYGTNVFNSLAAFLGANLRGHSYLPIDAHSPLKRIRMIVDSSQPAGVITTVPEVAHDLREIFKEFPIIYLEDVDFLQKGAYSLANALNHDDSNYLIYTSGTSGVPKGVEVSCDNLLTFTEWMLNDFEKIENNRILLQAPFSFDLSIFSIYPALLSAGTMVALSREETSNFKLLFERLNNTEINTWISTPSLVDICLLDPSFETSQHPKLQQFIFCGEELTTVTAKKLLKNFPKATVWNTYGPTEATGAVTSVKITEETLKNYSRLPIGRAKPGVEIKILAPGTLTEVPLGETGEIVIIGDSVAKGYYRNDEKSAKVFLTIDGKRAYRTGDAGLFDEAGELCYQGRIDFQIKMNGHRIELQGIESHLLAIDKVDKAIVVPNIGINKKVRNLIATIVPNIIVENEKDFIKQVKTRLSEKVMDYMLPSRFVLMKEFPLDQNGKVDRRAITKKLFE